MLDSSIARQPFNERVYQPIRYQEFGHIGELTFEFYNGAMSTEQCQRLEAWANIQAIDDVCLELLTTRQLVMGLPR